MAYAIQAELAKHGLRRSYNRLGYCTDNAHMESFYHSLKGELIRGRTFDSDKALRVALSSYIDGFYNRTRLHSGIGYASPINYETRAA
jgi:transposase InsO family protein